MRSVTILSGADSGLSRAATALETVSPIAPVFLIPIVSEEL